MELSTTVSGYSLSRTLKVRMTICTTFRVDPLNTGSVWRTSTPEPTYDGIIWTYIKDVTRYIPLFAKPGTFILELDNILQTGLNGQYASGYIYTPNTSFFISRLFLNSDTLCDFLFSFAGVSHSRTIEPHCPNLHHVK